MRRGARPTNFVRCIPIFSVPIVRIDARAVIAEAKLRDLAQSAQPIPLVWRLQRVEHRLGRLLLTSADRLDRSDRLGPQQYPGFATDLAQTKTNKRVGVQDPRTDHGPDQRPAPRCGRRSVQAVRWLLDEKQKGLRRRSETPENLVAGAGFEPATFGL